MLPSLRDANSASEYPRSLSSWLELDYFRRRGRLRRVRGPAGWAALLACAIILVVCAFLPGKQQIYQSAPVSTAHRMFNDDCAACHNVHFATASRLWHGDDAVQSVTDAACLTCHSGDVHHARQLGPSACADCHREHRGASELARVGDDHCTSCHADLKRHTASTAASDTDRAFRDIDAFVGGTHPHPPFALSERPVDPGTIRFNHRVHMNPGGLLMAGSLERRKLDCAACHQPDSERRYMQPIRYEAHCAACHPLPARLFDEPRGAPERAEADRFRSQPAPHPEAGEGTETVRALLRDRYLAFARRFPSVYGAAVAADTAGPLVGRRAGETAPPVRAESEWAERQLAQAERMLFAGEGGCRYCHQPAASAAAPETRTTLPAFEPPRIRARWLPHSVFSHDRHRSLDCAECHTRAGQSAQTSDVLIPGIESCRTCHTGTERGARSDCVECHAYHPHLPASQASHNLAIDDFVRGMGSHRGERRAKAPP